MIAISIVAILSAIAFPFFGNFIANRNLKSAARDIAGDIYDLRERASSEDRWYQVTFNQGANNYTLQRCTAIGSAACAGYDAAYSTKSPSSFGSGIVITSASFNGIAVLQMQPRGIVSPATGGNVQLRNSKGSTANINVNLMGRANVTWTLN